MAVTRSTAAERTRTEPASRAGGVIYTRGPEFLWLSAAACIVAIGLALVYLGKTGTAAAPGARPPLDLRRIDRVEMLLPYLDI